MSTPHLLTAMQRGLHALSAAFAVAGALALVVLSAVTVAGVFWRYVLRDPIFGIEDVATMALTVTVAGAVVWGATRGSHVSVNVIPWVAGRGLTRFTDAIARLVSVSVLGLASVALFKKGACGAACGAMTSNLSILHQPFFYTLGAAMGLFGLTVLLHLLIALAHWNGTDPNEVAD